MAIRINPDHDKMVCIECGHEIVIYDKKHSTFFGCEGCHAFFNQEPGKPTGRIHQLSKNGDYRFILPIGAQATISKKSFTVAGRLHKRDVSEYDLEWAEYLLYNPDTTNYFTLAEVNGNWWLVWTTEIDRFQVTNRGNEAEPDLDIKRKGSAQSFDKYAAYLFETVVAEGEFDWDVADESGKCKVTEYMKGEELLVSEAMDGETKWYNGRKVEKREVSRVFGIPMSDLLTLKRYPDDDEPGYIRRWPAMKKFTALALVVALIIWVATWAIAPSKSVYRGSYSTHKDTSAGSLNNMAMITSDPFTITAAGAVNIDFDVALDNEWIELAVEMVNEQTGRTYEFTKEVSYYHGYSDGESWTEGSRDENAVLSQVPAGTYRLVISPFAEVDRSFDIAVNVEQNTGLTSNTVLLLLLLLTLPCIQYSSVYNYNNSDDE